MGTSTKSKNTYIFLLIPDPAAILEVGNLAKGPTVIRGTACLWSWGYYVRI